MSANMASIACCPVQVVQDGGSVLSCALNATCAALVDAGVLLHNMFGKQAHLPTVLSQSCWPC